ncbi:hypothetical protein B0A55_00276 [Friedmanniomyces simplex]|uniref:Uncharacterized protein n=1 Tax=Friedmanniomyces simplex TaxID=329884 RepID=A0A4U0Y575_9PEZI|nr:hypothetical protein B0A55_00276 [Friedmanniomyces simplex]
MTRHTRSPFEYALLHSERREEDFRHQLFTYLDEPTLRHLRTVSPVIRDMVDSQPGRMFQDLFLYAPLDDDLPNCEFESVANFCHNLTITVRERFPPGSTPDRESRSMRTLSRPIWWQWKGSGSGADRQAPKRLTARISLPFGQLPETEQTAQKLAGRKWISIFTRCHALRHLTLRVRGDPGWPGRTEVEDTLVTLRRALEHSHPPYLREIHCDPVHAMGLLHLRWPGLGAFGGGGGGPPHPSPPTPQKQIWQTLHTLDLHLLNPFIPMGTLTPPQTLLLHKLLHDYLRALTPTLRTLRFVWLDVDGPSPLTLHLEAGLAGGGAEREPLRWEALQEVWLGNITFPTRTLQNAAFVAPRLERLWVLRSTHRSSRFHYSNPEAWVDHLAAARKKARDTVHPARPPDLTPATADDSSSLYSRSVGSSVADLSDGELGGVSRTSRDVLCMLDTTGIPDQALEMRRRMERGGR